MYFHKPFKKLLMYIYDLSVQEFPQLNFSYCIYKKQWIDLDSQLHAVMLLFQESLE